MAKKVDIIAEMKKAEKEKKLVIGSNNTIKSLRLGTLQKVVLSSNCPEKVREDIKSYAELNKTAVHELSIPNEELGVICKKQFAVSILGILK